MRFLINTKRKMYGNLVCLTGNFISCTKNVFLPITANKLKSYTQNTHFIPMPTYSTLALTSWYYWVKYNIRKARQWNMSSSSPRDSGVQDRDRKTASPCHPPVGGQTSTQHPAPSTPTINLTSRAELSRRHGAAAQTWVGSATSRNKPLSTCALHPDLFHILIPFTRLILILCFIVFFIILLQVEPAEYYTVHNQHTLCSKESKLTFKTKVATAIIIVLNKEMFWNETL